MRYLGIDVHVSTTVFCLLDGTGEVVEQGSVPTTVAALQELVKRLTQGDPPTVGQEVGKMSYLVHDALTAVGVPIKSFNAHHLRMIARSTSSTRVAAVFAVRRPQDDGQEPRPLHEKAMRRS